MIQPPPTAGTFNPAQYADFLAKSGDVYARTKYEVLLRWLGNSRKRVINAGCGSGELSNLLAAGRSQKLHLTVVPSGKRMAAARCFAWCSAMSSRVTPRRSSSPSMRSRAAGSMPSR